MENNSVAILQNMKSEGGGESSFGVVLQLPILVLVGEISVSLVSS